MESICSKLWKDVKVLIYCTFLGDNLKLLLKCGDYKQQLSPHLLQFSFLSGRIFKGILSQETAKPTYL